MTKRVGYEELPDLELDAEIDEKVRAMTARADRDVDEARVSLRWGRGQLAVVKTAARLMGVPYHTYLKQVVFRQALADIQIAQGAARGGR